MGQQEGRTDEVIEGDRVVRAMTNDGAFRLIAARTTVTSSDIVKLQGATGETARSLAELINASILYRETMAPGLRVQCIVNGAGGQLVADSNPDGWARGLLQSKHRSVSLAAGAMVQMMRSLPRGNVHRGVIELDRGGTISDALVAYMHESEQITSMVSVRAAMDGEDIVAVGGYLLQILPEAPDKEGALAVLAQRLEDDFVDIEARIRETDASPEHLVEEVFWGMEYVFLGKSALRSGCACSLERVMGSLATLGAADIQSFIDDGKTLEMGCDYCNTEYLVEPEHLRGLLASS